MARYKATVIRTYNNEQVYLEKGMSVDFVSFAHPWLDNGKVVKEAFRRVYGIDFSKGGGCSPAFIEVVEV
ncbi:DUF6140 family protein [Myroides odoratimimus]|uniref:DUF6140 family protein n=1 Tax=Myroides odoratimimus TaxID=76832 RepID=UPI0009191CBC|nr:DUF6140 family protein [Myroides odoratimimus]SHL90137.1 hypothetical protein SAMN05444275_107147 [Myroides odoratimimus subsp. xuanwuensis]